MDVSNFKSRSSGSSAPADSLSNISIHSFTVPYLICPPLGPISRACWTLKWLLRLLLPFYPSECATFDLPPLAFPFLVYRISSSPRRCAPRIDSRVLRENVILRMQVLFGTPYDHPRLLTWPRKDTNTVTPRPCLSIDIHHPTPQQVTTYASAYIREEESHRRLVTSTSTRRTSAFSPGKSLLASNLPGLLVLRAYAMENVTLDHHFALLISESCGSSVSCMSSSINGHIPLLGRFGGQ
jgi:hypothetical protein